MLLRPGGVPVGSTSPLLQLGVSLLLGWAAFGTGRRLWRRLPQVQQRTRATSKAEGAAARRATWARKAAAQREQDRERTSGPAG